MASESSHQQAVIKWSQQPSVRERYPELALLHHIKNETKEGVKQVAVDKAMGVKKGVPDLHVPVARGGCARGGAESANSALWVSML